MPSRLSETGQHVPVQAVGQPHRTVGEAAHRATEILRSLNLPTTTRPDSAPRSIATNAGLAFMQGQRPQLVELLVGQPVGLESGALTMRYILADFSAVSIRSKASKKTSAPTATQPCFSHRTRRWLCSTSTVA